MQWTCQNHFGKNVQRYFPRFVCVNIERPATSYNVTLHCVSVVWCVLTIRKMCVQRMYVEWAEFFLCRKIDQWKILKITLFFRKYYLQFYQLCRWHYQLNQNKVCNLRAGSVPSFVSYTYHKLFSFRVAFLVKLTIIEYCPSYFAVHYITSELKCQQL